MLTPKSEASIRMVQMIPLRRCGSHAIRLRLSNHPEFYSPYPLHIVDFMPLVSLYGNLRNDRNYFQLIVDVAGLQALSLVKWNGVALDPIRIFERIKDKPRSIHTVAWEILLEASAQKSAKVVMEKSLDNVRYWKDLVRIYPEMTFINLVRDPRAQVSSMNLAIIHEFDALLNARILAGNYACADALIRKHPEKVLTVRFEDFIARPEEELKRICEFTGLEYIRGMDDVSRSDEAKAISVQSSLWKTNSSAPIPAYVDKFKKTLSEEEIAVIETVCRKPMQRYGYEFLTSGGVKVSPRALAQAAKRSAAKKKAAWLQMSREKPQDFILRKRRIEYISLCSQALGGPRIPYPWGR